MYVTKRVKYKLILNYAQITVQSPTCPYALLIKIPTRKKKAIRGIYQRDISEG